MLKGPILLSLDGSEISEGVIPFVRQLAKGFGVKVTAFHVAGEDGTPEGKIVRMPSGKEMSTDAYLQSMVQEISRGGIGADSAAVKGKPAAEIVKYAESKGCGLIAMATHGRSGLGRWVYGSTTDRVLHATSLPMLLVRPAQDGRIKEETFRTLVIPLDGSELGERALPHAETLAKSLSLSITLVRVVPTVTIASGAMEPYAADPRLLEYSLDAAKQYIDEKTQALTKKGLRVSSKVNLGYAPSEIIDIAEGLPGSLVVMTTHGRSGVGRWVLGSVADRVLRASNRPVFLHR